MRKLHSYILSFLLKKLDLEEEHTPRSQANTTRPTQVGLHSYILINYL